MLRSQAGDGCFSFCDTFFFVSFFSRSQVNEIFPFYGQKAMRREHANQKKKKKIVIAWTPRPIEVAMPKMKKSETQETISRLRRCNGLPLAEQKHCVRIAGTMKFYVLNNELKCWVLSPRCRCCSSSQAIFWCWHVCEPLLFFFFSLSSPLPHNFRFEHLAR